MFKIRRCQFNFIVDALLFLNLMALAGIGFLVNWVLLRGSERNVVYGRDVDLTFLGMDRHGWGEIHLILGFIFLGLTVLHIYCHWRAICDLLRGMIENVLVRRVVMVCFLVISVMLLLFSVAVKPTLIQESKGHGYGKYEEGRGRGYGRGDGRGWGRQQKDGTGRTEYPE